MSRFLLSLGVLAASVAAQAPNDSPPPRTELPGARDPEPVAGSVPGRVLLGTSATADSGLQYLEDRWLASGPDYRAEFGSDRVVFTPALGRAAKVAHNLELATESVGRGSALRPVDTAMFTGDGDVARYRRPQVVETYEVRDDGIKQNFVFEQLPEGSGDLVVRVEIVTSMALQHTAHDALRFGTPGVGGVSIGAVIGFDATGRQASGSMRYDAGVLEMRLPSSFVESAVLPVTVDPLLSSVVVSTTDNEDPDVVCHPTTGRRLVVWQRYFSSSDSDVIGRLYDSGGFPVSGSFFVRSVVGELAIDPEAAFVASDDHYVVVWGEDLDVYAASVDATGSVGPLAQVTNTSDIETMIDLGGAVDGLDNDALAIWSNLSTGDLEGIQLQVTSTGFVQPISKRILATSTSSHTELRGSIASRGGPSGNYLIVWERNWSTASEGNVIGRVFSKDMIAVTPEFNIAVGSDDDDDPAVDGDGTNWVVAWETEPDSGSGDHDVVCVGVTYDAAASLGVVTTTQVVVEGTPNDDEIDADVAWLGDSALVSFLDEVSGSLYNAYVTSVDPFNCTLCEGEFSIEVGTRDTKKVAIASGLGGFPLNPQAMVVWDPEDTAASERDIMAAPFSAKDGVVTEISAGTCTSGGTAYASCAIEGNGNFQFRTQRANPNSLSYLLISPFASENWCGTCRIIPDLFVGFSVNAGSSNSRGDVSLSMPIPASSSLVGAQIWSQWLVQSTSGCFNYGVSPALAIVIE